MRSASAGFLLPCCMTREASVAALVTKTRQPVAGATVNFQGQHGRTPLHKAAEKAFPVLIKALCEARADPDSRDHFGALPQPNKDGCQFKNCWGLCKLSRATTPHDCKLMIKSEIT